MTLFRMLKKVGLAAGPGVLPLQLIGWTSLLFSLRAVTTAGHLPHRPASSCCPRQNSHCCPSITQGTEGSPQGDQHPDSVPQPTTSTDSTQPYKAAGLDRSIP
jgi:hypothetical protein